MPKELEEWIKSQSNSFTPEEIENQLIKNGYSSEDISLAFSNFDSNKKNKITIPLVIIGIFIILIVVFLGNTLLTNTFKTSSSMMSRTSYTNENTNTDVISIEDFNTDEIEELLNQKGVSKEELLVRISEKSTNKEDILNLSNNQLYYILDDITSLPNQISEELYMYLKQSNDEIKLSPLDITINKNKKIYLAIKNLNSDERIFYVKSECKDSLNRPINLVYSRKIKINNEEVIVSGFYVYVENKIPDNYTCEMIINSTKNDYEKISFYVRSE